MQSEILTGPTPDFNSPWKGFCNKRNERDIGTYRYIGMRTVVYCTLDTQGRDRARHIIDGYSLYIPPNHQKSISDVCYMNRLQFVWCSSLLGREPPPWWANSCIARGAGGQTAECMHLGYILLSEPRVRFLGEWKFDHSSCRYMSTPMKTRAQDTSKIHALMPLKGKPMR